MIWPGTARWWNSSRGTIQIHEARLVAIPDADHAEFEMRCGKGAYVRAWVRDLARALGTVGHVSQLRRTRIGGFSADGRDTTGNAKGFYA